MQSNRQKLRACFIVARFILFPLPIYKKITGNAALPAHIAKKASYVPP
jgi:hypothetical protein